MSDGAMFTQAGRMTRGYEPQQVEKFFAHARATYEGEMSSNAKPLTARQVRIVGFDLVRGGYDVHQVDTALDRLEDALARRERDALRSRAGDQAVVEELTKRARKLHEVLSRPRGGRFESGAGFFELSYDVDEVDDLCDRLQNYFEGSLEMSPDEVRLAVFRSRRGRSGYRESHVDAYMDNVIEIMVMAD